MTIRISGKQQLHPRASSITSSGFPFTTYWFLQIIVCVERNYLWNLCYLVSSLMTLSGQAGALQLALSYTAFWADSRAPLGTRGFFLALQEMPLPWLPWTASCPNPAARFLLARVWKLESNVPKGSPLHNLLFLDVPLPFLLSVTFFASSPSPFTQLLSPASDHSFKI